MKAMNQNRTWVESKPGTLVRVYLSVGKRVRVSLELVEE